MQNVWRTAEPSASEGFHGGIFDFPIPERGRSPPSEEIRKLSWTPKAHGLLSRRRIGAATR